MKLFIASVEEIQLFEPPIHDHALMNQTLAVAAVYTGCGQRPYVDSIAVSWRTPPQ